MYPFVSENEGAPDDPELPGRLEDLVLGESVRPAVWWVGVHGGAGESTLERLFAGSRASGHRWPAGRVGERPPVVLVARTHAHGLRAVQTAVRDHAERDLAAQLVGLVLIADAPGRLPRALGELKRIVSGGVEHVWTLPFVEAWRVGDVPARRNSPKDATRLYEELAVVLNTSEEEQ